MSQPPVEPRPVRKRRRRIAAILLLLLVVGFAASEWLLRAQFGLGHFVAVIDDPQTEYRFAPDQHFSRLGHRIDFNHWSMRSEDFPQHRTDSRELRVLFIGDSIINGGSQSDQSELATEIVKQTLSKELNRPVVVGNISANSWGPENQLAYLKKFGTFDADLFVVVVSSHDAGDKIGPLPAAESKPAPPMWAWTEVYLQLKERLAPNKAASLDVPTADQDTPRADCLDAFAAMLRMIGPTRTIVVQHYEKAESSGKVKPGNAALAEVARREGVAAIVQDGPTMFESLAAGQDPWRDWIHLNALGQRRLALQVLPPLLTLVRSLPTTAPATMTP